MVHGRDILGRLATRGRCAVWAAAWLLAAVVPSARAGLASPPDPFFRPAIAVTDTAPSDLQTILLAETPDAPPAFRADMLAQPHGLTDLPTPSMYNPAGPFAADSHSRDDPQQVRELPPPPSSMVIALSGFATFGAFRLARSVKDIRLPSLPEWYHGGAPEQIGHATPWPPDANRSLVPTCWYEAIASVLDPPETWLYQCQPEKDTCWLILHFIPTIAPRSPPCSAVFPA